MPYDPGRFARSALIILPALLIYFYLASQLDYTQDDAFITFRYVANFLNCDGLVYNVGERVEGITNHGWAIFLALAGALRIDYIAFARFVGLAFGAGLIVLTYLLSLKGLKELAEWLKALPCYLVAINLSLAYWAPSGLETAAFAFVSMLALYLYLKRSWWLIFALAIAVWLRPEGALLTGILCVVEFYSTRAFPRFVARCSLVALAISLPYVTFKIAYYGSILPNSFHAKTGFDLLQLTNGLVYTGRFFTDYGFYGFGLILPLLFWRRLNVVNKSLAIFFILYVAYIVLIGGDVLEVHRFFIPLLGVSAILLTTGIAGVARLFPESARTGLSLLLAVAMGVLTYTIPRAYIDAYRVAGRGLNRKMEFIADKLKTYDQRPFTIAASTIGVLGYRLVGHDVIDMIGLTDTVISRHPEKPVEGLTTEWREQKHNSRYVLSRQPEYILFSTGIKPTALAEKTLLLYPQFINSYRTIAWTYDPSNTGRSGVLSTIFKLVRPLEGEIIATYPPKYVEEYKKGIDLFMALRFEESIKALDRAIAVSPEPYFPYLVYRKANNYTILQKHEVATMLYDRILQQDSLVFEAHKDLYTYAVIKGDSVGAALHKRWIDKLVPWYWPRLEQFAKEQVAENKARQTSRNRLRN